MAITMQSETTEYCFVGVTGTAPTVGAEVAFKLAGESPAEIDWSTATLVNDAHALWADAVASGATGDYYVARLVGSFGGTGVVLTEGEYQLWLRLTDTTERPVRIAPVVVEIA